MTSPIYGTDADLTTYSAEDQLLAKASRFIDRLLVGAYYSIDDQGIATDPTIQAAIKNATLAQASFWKSGYGSEFGPSQYKDVSIGSVRLSSSQGGTGTKRSDVAPQAMVELTNAGLLPIRPWTVG
ncbi:MAG: hypothetical protein ACREOZ_02220 [Gloeomargaritales cyanobacterium]